jgi:peptidoglycan hydrolase FlgJ
MVQHIGMNPIQFKMHAHKNSFDDSSRLPQSISCNQSNKLTESSELRKTCQAFESLFVNQVMKEMRDTITKDDFLDGGQAEQIYTSLLDEKFAEEIATNGSLGLAKKLYESLSKTLADLKS